MAKLNPSSVLSNDKVRKGVASDLYSDKKSKKKSKSKKKK